MSHPHKRKRERWLSGRMRGFPTWFLIDLSRIVSSERDIGEMSVALRDRRHELETELVRVKEAEAAVRRQNMQRMERRKRIRDIAAARLRRANDGE